LLTARNKSDDTAFTIDIYNPAPAFTLFCWLGWVTMRLLFLGQKSSQSVFSECPQDVLEHICITMWYEWYPAMRAFCLTTHGTNVIEVTSWDDV